MNGAANAKPRPPGKGGKPAGKPIPAANPRARAQAQQRGAKTSDVAALRAEVRALASMARRGDGTNQADLEGVVGAIIDPANHDPFRYPVDADRPTAVNRVFDIDAAGSAGAGASTLALAANCGFSAAFRDPRLARVKYETKTSGNTSAYNLMFESTSGGLGLTTPGPAAGQPFTPVQVNYTTGWKRHGNVMPVFRDKEGAIRFFWDCDTTGTSTTTNFTISGLGATTTYDFLLTVENNDVVQQFKQTPTAVAGVVVLPIPAGALGRWTITCLQDLTAQASVGITVSTSSPWSFRHFMAPEFENQLADVDTGRVNSVSMLFSDRTAEIYAQGSIVTYQASGSRDWLDLAGAAGPSLASGINNYSVVAKFNQAKNGPYHKGRYNFLKYGGADDLKMVQLTAGSGANVHLTPVDLGLQRGFLVMLYDATNATQLAGQWTITQHVEFETESQWRDVRTPHIHPRVFEDAQHVVGQADQDYENVNHVKNIGKFIGKVMRFVGRAAPAVAPLAGSYAAPILLAGHLARAIKP